MTIRQSPVIHASQPCRPDSTLVEDRGFRSRGLKQAWLCLGLGGGCAALCLFIVFRPFWLSHFDLILGDLVDGRFSIAILEHWTRVLQGKAAMSSPNFFFPERGALGFSDGDFLLALPYAVLRALGTDRYLAFQITIMLLTALGFAAMLHLLSLLRFTPQAAIMGSVLFVISNIYYIQIVHPQLVAVVFVPVLIILGLKYWERRTTPTLARIFIVSLAILLALLFFTSFYIAWFAVLCGASVALFNLFIAIVMERRWEPASRAARFVWAKKFDFLLAIVTFSVAMIPFLRVYLPAARLTGPRTLASSLYYMPSGMGLFDVGKQNLIWGRMSTAVEGLISPEGMHEHPSGWPYLTMLLFFATALYCGTRMFTTPRPGSCPERRRYRTISALSLTWLFWWFAGVKLRNHAFLWAVVRKIVPGATAIRVPSRVDLVLNLAIVMVSMFGWELLMRSLAGHRVRVCIVAVLLPALLCLEQINRMPTHLISRAREAKKFSKLQPPPSYCSAFYISNWSNTKPGIRAIQTDAMLVAEEFQIPTLNGYSGWFPAGWDLLSGSKEQIAAAARLWAGQHGISAGLCALDVSAGKWSPLDLQEPPRMGSPPAGEVRHSLRRNDMDVLAAN